MRAGLEALEGSAPDVVLVHDAARPLIPAGTIPALLAALEHAAGRNPRRAGRRYAEARGRRPDRRHRVARRPVPCPDAPGIPFSGAARRTSQRRRGRDRRCLAAGGDRRAGGDRPRLRGQHQAYLCRGPAPAGACHDRTAVPARRHRLRCPCAGSGPAADAVRRRGAARQGAGRPLRRRCRHPCAVRRDLRRAGRGRYRPAFPALRGCLEGCRQRPLPGPRRRTDRRARWQAGQCRRDADLRTAEDRPARRRNGSAAGGDPRGRSGAHLGQGDDDREARLHRPRRGHRRPGRRHRADARVRRGHQMKHCAVARPAVAGGLRRTAGPPAPMPPPMAETMPRPPVSPVPLIWQPGHWDWTGSSYVWAPGQYVDLGGPQRHLDAGLLGDDRLWLGLAAGPLVTLGFARYRLAGHGAATGPMVHATSRGRVERQRNPSPAALAAPRPRC